MQSWNQNAIDNEFCYWYFLKRQDICIKMAKCVCLAWKLQYLPGAGIGATWKSQIWQPECSAHCHLMHWGSRCIAKRCGEIHTSQYSTVRYVVEYIAMRYSTVRYDPVHCGEIRCAGERHHLTVPSCSGEAPRAVESKTRHNAVRIVVALRITNSSGALQCFELNHNILRCAAGWRAWAARGWLDWCLS